MEEDKEQEEKNTTRDTEKSGEKGGSMRCLLNCQRESRRLARIGRSGAAVLGALEGAEGGSTQCHRLNQMGNGGCLEF